MLSTSSPRFEPVPLRRDGGFVVRLFRKPRFDFIWHSHPEIEVTLILEGRGVRYTGNRTEPFYEGDLCLFGANFPHAYGSHPSSLSARWIVIQFLPETWGQEFWELGPVAPLARMLGTPGGFHFGTLRPDDPLYRRIGEAAGRERLGLFLHLLEELSDRGGARALGPAAPLRTTTPDTRLGHVMARLESGDPEAFNQQLTARAVGMSPAAFSRFFRRATGRTFQRYCNEVRVARVCVDLAAGERTIAEAAYAADFQNLANFGRRFREITGMTPREYRRMLTADDVVSA